MNGVTHFKPAADGSGANPRYVIRSTQEAEWMIIDLTTDKQHGRAYLPEEVLDCYREAVILNAAGGYIS